MPDSHTPDPRSALACLVHEAESLLGLPELNSAQDAELAQVMEEIETLVAGAPADVQGLARRIDRVRAGYALQMRSLPEAALDGLYDDVRRSLRSEDAWLRAGMSEAFLDAPRNLLLWRRVALTACLLLAVGAGYQLRAGQLPGAPDAGPAGRELQMSDLLGTRGVSQGQDPRSGRGGARWGPVQAEQASFGSHDGAIHDGAIHDGAIHDRASRDPGARAFQAEGGWGRRRGLQRAPGMRGMRAGVYVFQPGAEAAADAGRMLDRIQIFPVPGREIVVGEDN